MRRLPVLAIAVVGLIAPATAAAQDCPQDVLPSRYSCVAVLELMVSPAMTASGPMFPGDAGYGAAREGLGAQYGGLAFDEPRLVWTVSYSPGNS